MLPCAALTPALNVIGPLARVSVFSWGVRIEARWWPLRAVFGRWQVRYEDLAQVRLARFAETAPTRWVRLVRHDGTAPALCGTRCPGALLEAIHAAGGPVVDGTERVDWIDAEEHVAKAGR